jgi:hypothetical protein
MHPLEKVFLSNRAAMQKLCQEAVFEKQPVILIV